MLDKFHQLDIFQQLDDIILTIYTCNMLKHWCPGFDAGEVDSCVDRKAGGLEGKECLVVELWHLPF